MTCPARTARWCWTAWKRASGRPRGAGGLDDVALERRAEVLDQRRLDLGRAAFVERAGDAQRQAPQGGQPRDQRAERRQHARVVLGLGGRGERGEQRERAEDAL